MYLRAAHAELDIPLLRNFIVDNPLGILFTALQSPRFPTLQCSHIPWILDVVDEQVTKNLGKLRGHMAKPNPHTKAIVESAQAAHPSNGTLEQEVSVIFNGPVHHYVTPKFYTKTKPETGKVVPTWNYSAVQVYGKATIFFDPANADTDAFLQRQVQDLTRHAEEHVMQYTGGNRPSAWQVSDAPTSYVELLKKNIVGIEIDIQRLEGKFKMSQEMGSEDRQGVIEGFQRLQSDDGCAMAQTVELRGTLKDTKAAAARLVR